MQFIFILFVSVNLFYTAAAGTVSARKNITVKKKFYVEIGIPAKLESFTEMLTVVGCAIFCKQC